jgi:hypothetical protein
MPEANLIDVAHEASPYEDVVCVGLFQPAAREIPQWSLVAVTEKKVHIFAVRSIVPYVTVSEPRLFVSLDRTTTVARTIDNMLVLTDTDTGRDYRFDSSAGQGECVINELQRS